MSENEQKLEDGKGGVRLSAGLGVTICERKFFDLPLGTRFRYPGQEPIWVIIAHHDCGLIAEWRGIDGPRAMQSICSAAESENDCRALLVIPVE